MEPLRTGLEPVPTGSKFLHTSLRPLCTGLKPLHTSYELTLYRNVAIPHWRGTPCMGLEPIELVRMFSKHRPSGLIFSISQNARLCVCVCLSVCSLLRYWGKQYKSAWGYEWKILEQKKTLQVLWKAALNISLSCQCVNWFLLKDVTKKIVTTKMWHKNCDKKKEEKKVLSKFEFLGFLIILALSQFEFCHNLSFVTNSFFFSLDPS